MTSDAFTNEPKCPTVNADSPAVEFNLHLEDHLALYLFAYDMARAARRGLPSFLHAACSIVVLVLCFTWNALENQHWRLVFRLGSWIFVALYVLLCLGAGRLFAGFCRSFYQGRMTRLIRDGQRVGLYNPKRQDRVVMTDHYFLETNDLHDTSAFGVEISEHEETRVEWPTVVRIDVTEEHAFFTVKDRGYLVLPRRAFADEASFRVFVDTARSYWKEAHRTRAPIGGAFSSPNTNITQQEPF